MEKGVSILLIHVNVSEEVYRILSDKAGDIDTQIGDYCASVLASSLEQSEDAETIVILREANKHLDEHIAELEAIVKELQKEKEPE